MQKADVKVALTKLHVTTLITSLCLKWALFSSCYCHSIHNDLFTEYLQCHLLKFLDAT